MKYIRIHQPHSNANIHISVIVDDVVFVWASKHSWYVERDGSAWYAYRYVRNEKRRLHVEIMERSGSLPHGMKVDHIDGNGLNCQRSNLRIVTTQQNAMNNGKHAPATSQYKGVTQRPSGKWAARITVEVVTRTGSHMQTRTKCLYLGDFHEEKNAAMAYNVAALKWFGEFARLNVF